MKHVIGVAGFNRDGDRSETFRRRAHGGFLKNGGVFDDDFIDAYIELKMTEVARYEMTPHPVELYYSL